MNKPSCQNGAQNTDFHFAKTITRTKFEEEEHEKHFPNRFFNEFSLSKYGNINIFTLLKETLKAKNILFKNGGQNISFSHPKMLNHAISIKTAQPIPPPFFFHQKMCKWYLSNYKKEGETNWCQNNIFSGIKISGFFFHSLKQTEH